MNSTPETFLAPERTGSARRATKDAVLLGAVELARQAAAAEAGSDLGEYLGFELEGERIGTHYFATTAPGYAGWRWFVTLTRPPRSRTPSVSDLGLLPGEGALLAPAWVPWSDRLAPEDVSATDRLPYIPDDERLEPGYVATGDEETDRIAIRELGLGRDRVMNRKALDAAATRWYNSSRGPDTTGSRKAGADCASCGFVIPLAGSMGNLFGVCANEWSPDDGKVVSLDHGCGAHSETDVRRRGGEWNQSEPHLDDLELEVVQAVERDDDEGDDDEGDGDASPDSAGPDATNESSDDDQQAERDQPAEPADSATEAAEAAGKDAAEPEANERSEERRVGKGSRGRGRTAHENE